MAEGYIRQNAEAGLKDSLAAFIKYQRPYSDSPEALSVRGVFMVGEEEDPRGARLADNLDRAREAVLNAVNGDKEKAAAIEKELNRKLRASLKQVATSNNGEIICLRRPLLLL